MMVYPFKLFFKALFLQSLEVVENVKVISLIQKPETKELSELTKMIRLISHLGDWKSLMSLINSALDIFPLLSFCVMAKLCSKYIGFTVQHASGLPLF